METRLYRKILTKSALVALVTVLAFSAGITVGSTGSAAAVVAKVPFVGDGLNSTPDTTADLTDFWKAWHILEEKYVLTNASSSLPTKQELIFGAISGLASAYGDPYTTFLPPEESAAFEESISGSFGGVGMEIAIKDNVLTVVAPLKGTPAERSGIKAGDKIVAIDGDSTEGLSIEEAVSAIRGPIDTTVELSIIRDGTLETITVTRATIRVPQTEDGLDTKTGVYHIALYEFTGSSVNLFNEALTRFRATGGNKLVIDLRGNPGGYLDAAVNITSHFLPKGATIVTEDFDGKRDNNVHVSRGFTSLRPNTKIVVLIDGGSASASEILAGALKDAKVATIIGTRSFGKGSVQQLVHIGDASLKVTVARWITPAGNWIMGNGITPDIEVSITKEDIAADIDPQMERAVKFLTTGK